MDANIFHIMIIWYICRKKFGYGEGDTCAFGAPAEQVGATKSDLRHAGLSGNGTVCTKRAVIKQSTLVSGGSGACSAKDGQMCGE